MQRSERLSPGMPPTGAADRPGMAHGHAPALDGIRGIAILLVVIYHFVNSLNVLSVATPALKPFDLGWCGVDIFFALSGFLITGILIDTKDAPRYFSSFYARRVLRIFPLYYMALLAVFLLRAALPQVGIWGAHATLTSPGSLAWPAAFLQNVAIVLGGRGPTGVTTHYWSLAVEEHFYLVWPLLVWLARNRSEILAMAVCALAASILGRGLVWLHGTDLNHVFGLTPLRLDGLALGAGAAVLVREHALAKLAPWAALALGGSVAALAGLILLRHSLEQTDAVLWLLAFPLVSTGSAAAIVLGLGRGWLARLLSLDVLRWFGKYSFGIYVWHPILGVLLFHSSVGLTRPGAPAVQVILAAAAILALDLAVAYVSYHWVEKRFLALKRHFPADRPQTEPASSAPEPAGALPNAAP